MGDIGMLKEVLLAWLLCGKRGAFRDVVGLLGSVGLCRRYALEAITNVIIYLHDHN